MRAATDAAASAPPPLLLTEPFETDVLVQVDLVAPAPVTPDDELATAPLIEQLPEVVSYLSHRWLRSYMYSLLQHVLSSRLE